MMTIKRNIYFLVYYVVCITPDNTTSIISGLYFHNLERYMPRKFNDPCPVDSNKIKIKKSLFI